MTAVKNKNSIIAILVIVALTILVSVVFLSKNNVSVPSQLDDFAKCLADKKITMYGAYWCAHCQNEKKAFGSSFKFVPYVECTEDTQKCLADGIEVYPTWILPASSTGGLNGQKLVGEQGIKKLSEASGCPLP